jgi:hypothetical protein
MVIEFISLLLTMAALKGMMGALAPFNYLVLFYSVKVTKTVNIYNFSKVILSVKMCDAIMKTPLIHKLANPPIIYAPTGDVIIKATPLACPIKHFYNCNSYKLVSLLLTVTAITQL